jgi:hypothetical protein
VDAERFDRWTQALEARLPRRGLSALAVSTLATLGLGAAAADAKNKKKKKRKKRRKKKNKNNPPLPPPLPPGANTSCQNLGTACGNTAICQCRLDKNSVQTCENVQIPPNGINFQLCQANVNCGPGQVCDAQASLCVSACAN